MMGIVTGRRGESPLGFRANPQIRGPARRLVRRVAAARRGIAASAAIAALISAAVSVVGAAQWPEPTRLTAGMQDEHGGPAPLGELTPDPPEVPQQTANQIAPPPVAAPPPRAQQPQ